MKRKAKTVLREGPVARSRAGERVGKGVQGQIEKDKERRESRERKVRGGRRQRGGEERRGGLERQVCEDPCKLRHVMIMLHCLRHVSRHSNNYFAPVNYKYSNTPNTK